jgi:hypothetical protein
MVLSVQLVAALVLLSALGLYLVWRRKAAEPQEPWPRNERLALTGIISTATLTLLGLVVNSTQGVSGSSGGVPAATQPATPSTSQSVVTQVLEAEDPKAAYDALDEGSWDEFDDAMLPAHYDVELDISPDMPSNLTNSYTLPRGYICADRTAAVTALSETRKRIYSFELAGYWCMKDGVVFQKKVRRYNEQVHMTGWERASNEMRSGFTDNTQTTAYLRSAHRFRLANIADEAESLYIVGVVTGPASVCRVLEGCPGWPS